MSLTSLITSSSSLVYHITSNQENLNLQTLFGTSKYQAKIDKRVIIASGVTVGATSTANYALNMPSGFGGRLILVNEGSILGAGGAANSGTGGSCINAGASNIYIDNRGTISSGGGGGGKGGTGGQGSYVTSYNCSYAAPICTCPVCCGYSCTDSAPCSGGYVSSSGCAEGGFRWVCPQTCYTTNYTSGGAGGNGGRGQGYDAGAASGSGGATGGTNAGTGGAGGTGGSYGSSGNNGNTGANGNYTNGSAGSSGGLAGFYIVNNGNVNWVANGTRNGRIG